MKLSLRSRLTKLEAYKRATATVTRSGYVVQLPTGFVGERHVVMISRKQMDEGVYFGSEVAEGYALQFLNFADGKIKRIITSAGRAFGRLGASRDGRRLLYARQNLRESELMLVENFH